MTETTNPPAEAARPRRLPLWVIILSFAVLIGFMALIGWGLKRAMLGSMSIGDKVPEISSQTFEAQPIASSQFTGKVVLVNFWASWCQPCEQEAAELEEAYQHYKPGGQVAFVGLTWQDTRDNSLAYLKRFMITYPNGPDLQGRLGQMFRVRGVPETFIIDQDGRLAYFKAGPFASTDEIIGVIDGILKK